MKVYWRWTDLPELQGLSQVDQIALWEHAWRTSYRSLRVWRGCALMGSLWLIIGTGIILAPTLLDPFPTSILDTIAGIMVGTSLLGGAFSQVIVAAVRPALARQRAALDMAKEAPSTATGYFVPPAF